MPNTRLKRLIAALFIATQLGAQAPSAGPWLITGGSTVNTAILTLTNTQIVTLFSAPTLVIPAPAAGSLIQIVGATLENINGGTAYTSGGNIAFFYGNSASPPLVIASSAAAATFLTAPTVTTIVKLTGAVPPNTANTATAMVGAAVYIGAITANFAQVGNAGTMLLQVQYLVSAGW